MAYTVQLRPRARKTFLKLDTSIQKSIRNALQALAEQPYPPDAKPLTGHYPYRRIRVRRDYRIVYTIDDTQRVVTVALLGHRREVYRKL